MMDHLVYAAPDFKQAIAEVTERFGIAPAPGGQHPRWGTRNALLGFDESSYLEIIGPDPDQPAPSRPRPFGMDNLTKPKFVAWAAKTNNIHDIATRAMQHGIGLGEVKEGSRKKPDGSLLNWQFTDLASIVEEGVIPFFIDWGASPHPARTAPRGLNLMRFYAEHPDPQRITMMLRALQLDLEVRPGSSTSLVAVIQSPKGIIELR